jgi:hypothetical protein
VQYRPASFGWIRPSRTFSVSWLSSFHASKGKKGQFRPSIRRSATVQAQVQALAAGRCCRLASFLEEELWTTFEKVGSTIGCCVKEKSAESLRRMLAYVRLRALSVWRQAMTCARVRQRAQFHWSLKPGEPDKAPSTSPFEFRGYVSQLTVLRRN